MHREGSLPTSGVGLERQRRKLEMSNMALWLAPPSWDWRNHR